MIKKIYTYLQVSCFLIVFLMAGVGCEDQAIDEPTSNTESLVVVRQTWTEYYILGELFKMMIEENSDIVVDLVDLESTALMWKAFENGEIDIWPSYTSSLYMTVLGDTGLRDPDAVYDYVQNEFKTRYNAVFLERVGFYNNYDLAVRPEIAEEYELETYSDLAKVAEELTVVADINFVDREDCYPLLQDKYGIDFKEIKSIGVSLKYPTIEAGEADVISVYSTDAQIASLGLVLLKDDNHAFPPYEVAPLLRDGVLEQYPQLEEILNSLSGQITNSEMQTLNYRVEIEKEDPVDVVREFLESKGLV